MMPKNSSGSPSHCRSQPSVTCSSSVNAGEVAQCIPLVFSVAISISAMMAGVEPVQAK